MTIDVPISAASAASIDDHAIIGDCASAALVTRNGTIDWMCWPRFDSDPVFASLLDPEHGGYYRVAPTDPVEVTRCYLPDTAVLETTFRTEGGVVTLTDAMLVDPAGTPGGEIRPDHELLRRVRCETGRVEIEVTFAPRFDWGRRVPEFAFRRAVGHVVSDGRQVLVLRADIHLEERPEGCLTGTHVLEAGDEVQLVLAYDREQVAVLPLTGAAAEQALQHTIAYWKDWAGRGRYEGPYAQAVVRSAITVKLLAFSRSGAIVAAPTTSLPEVPGGRANWDYRYCWLRDAALSLRALFELGYTEEGRAFFDWLLYTARDEERGLAIMYDVYGRKDLGKRVLHHLSGYRGARPVRVGNAAVGQFQLDVYGELVSTAYEYLQRGEPLDRAQAKVLIRLGEMICARWREPDNGIWELRGSRRHYTYSKAMCWVGLQRLLELGEQGHLRVPSPARWERTRDEIREWVEANGYDTDLGSFVAAAGGDDLDASLMLLVLYGYAKGDDERMQGTIDVVDERLGRGPLVHRFLDPPGAGESWAQGEGAFVICSYWVVEALAEAGRLDEATERFEAMLGYGNDVGLLSEEIDPRSGAQLGNMPQAFSHVGLLNAAMTLERMRHGGDHPPEAAGRGATTTNDGEHGQARP